MARRALPYPVPSRIEQNLDTCCSPLIKDAPPRTSPPNPTNETQTKKQDAKEAGKRTDLRLWSGRALLSFFEMCRFLRQYCETPNR
jgi:hypothetical protein